MKQLVRYEQARRALEEAHRIDEVKDIADKAEAMRLYARQAKDPDMEMWIAEIRLRALRRIGELSKELDKHERARTDLRPDAGKQTKRTVLSDAGLSTSQAHRCEQLASIPKRQFERHLAERRDAGKPVTAEEVLSKLVQGKRREEKIERIVTDAGALDSLGPFNVIYADPPWEYEHVKTESRSIENQYPTMSLDAICDLEVPAADDAVLFLWATSPKLAEALSVIDAWDFTYRTCMVWVKDKIGMGYYARQKHELLLIATRGVLPTPEPKNRPSSVVEAPRGKHSAKPEEFYSLIEEMYPEFDGLRLEMFCRNKRDGWEPWGFEA